MWVYSEPTLTGRIRLTINRWSYHLIGNHLCVTLSPEIKSCSKASDLLSESKRVGLLTGGNYSTALNYYSKYQPCVLLHILIFILCFESPRRRTFVSLTAPSDASAFDADSPLVILCIRHLVLTTKNANFIILNRTIKSTSIKN